MSQIIIKSEDPLHGMSTKSFTTREEAEAYMDSIGLVKTPPKAEDPVEEPVKAPAPKVAKPAEKPATKPVAKAAPKPSKAKKR